MQNSYNSIASVVPYKKIKVAPSIVLLADKAWFYGCSFISVQDTLADLVGRHYFKNCYIEGAIDFIWGGGQSLYEVISYKLSYRKLYHTGPQYPNELIYENVYLFVDAEVRDIR